MCAPTDGVTVGVCPHGDTSRNPLAAACSAVLPQPCCPSLEAAACLGAAATEARSEDLVSGCASEGPRRAHMFRNHRRS